MGRGFIKERVPVVELLAGLAEESSELAQAALKLRRVFVSNNPTPVSEDQAIENLWEEIADVNLYVSLLDINLGAVSEYMQAKQRRWEERLKSIEGN